MSEGNEKHSPSKMFKGEGQTLSFNQVSMRAPTALGAPTISS